MQLGRFGQIVSEGTWLVAGQVASLLGTIVLVRTLTELLTPAEYGRLALALTMTGLINQVVMGPLASSVARFYAIASQVGDRGGYYRASFHLINTTCRFLAVAGATLAVVMPAVGLRHHAGLTVVAVLFSIASGYTLSFSALHNAARQRAVVACHAALEAWLRIAFAVALLSSAPGSSMAVLLAYALSAAVAAVSQYLWLPRDAGDTPGRAHGTTRWAHEMWTYSLPFATWGGFTWLQQSSDRWALETFASTHEVGLYAGLFQVGYTPTTLAFGLALSTIAPILYQRAGDATDPDTQERVRTAVSRLALFTLCATAGAGITAAFFHSEIFALVLAADFRPISHLLPWVLLAGGVFGTGQLLAHVPMSQMRSHVLTTPKVVTALIGVAANYFLASKYGLGGVVAALLCFSTVYLAFMAALVMRATASQQPSSMSAR